MKLYTFETHQQRRIGAELDGQLVDLSLAYNAWLAAHGPKPGALRVLPSEMLSFIRLGTLASQAAYETLQFMKKRPAVPVGEQLLYSFEQVRILAPIQRPGKILCWDFEGFTDTPAGASSNEPLVYSKLPSTVVSPGDPIFKPKAISELHCSVTLAAIIGRRIKAAPEEDVMNAIFGYTILNDLCARDPQWTAHQRFLGRNFDTFSPLGPCIIAAGELPDVSRLAFRSEIGGKLQKESSDWVASLPRLVSFLSQAMTLEPGDIVSAGSRSAFETPLRVGDEVTLTIEEIGTLTNKITDEPPPSARTLRESGDTQRLTKA